MTAARGSASPFAVPLGALRIILHSRLLYPPVPYERIGSQLAVVDIATGEVELITHGFTNVDPDWRP